jgi:glycogen debranching enzyme
MDTNHPAGTPREGYPIEIQALWFAALRFFSRIGGKRNGRKWELLAEKVRSSIHDLFFMADEGYLSDCLHARPGTPARRGEVDDALRPNQLLAVTMGAVSDPVIGRKAVNSCETLVVPGAIRSLADQRVRRPLEIVRDGNLLSDPYHPYQGEYVGDEDSRRKPAYHNGTAWTWLFPSFCEAWGQVYGRKGIPTAKAILASGVRWIGLGCVGHLPEILDGNYPHTPRGCDAQAWGVSEAVRVWEKLSSAEGPSDSPV